MQSQIRQVKELELTPDDSVVSVYRTKNFIDKNIDERAIKTSLYNIFSWAPGERVINPEFGSKLMKYLYNGITATNQEQIVAEIKNCCMKWEPRVFVQDVINLTTTKDIEDKTVNLEIRYSIPSISEKQYSLLISSPTHT